MTAALFRLRGPLNQDPPGTFIIKLETNMNLHNTSNPVASGREELVPSRYALKVGEIDVLVVSDGVLPLPTTMLAHNAAPTERAAQPRERGPSSLRAFRERSPAPDRLTRAQRRARPSADRSRRC